MAIKKEIKEIKERNKKVELDKAWETSFMRRGLLIIFTYLAIGIYLRAINIERPWLNAIVPAVAFMLSTLTLPYFKKLWIEFLLKKESSKEKNHIRKNKRAMFFSTDALIALSIIFLTVMIAYPFINQDENQSELETDVLKALASLRISEINNSYVVALINSGEIKNLDNSVLEQIGEFYVSNITLARELSEEVLFSLDSSENIGIWFGSDLIYSANSSSYEESEIVDVSTQVISGISGATTNGSVTGFSARAWLSNVLPQKYFYFGGYVGDGNISINMYLNYTGELSDIEIEMAINKDFDLYINGIYSGRYENSSSSFSPAKYNLVAYNSSFNTGGNIIKLVGDGLFVAGGNIKVIYESLEDYRQETRHYFSGVEGAINLYDGFYVPGNLTGFEISLHFDSEYETFLTIGNVTVFNGSTVGEETKVIDNSVLSSYFPDYSDLSQKTIPFRFGLKNASYLITVVQEADAVSVTDLSGSMCECSDFGWWSICRHNENRCGSLWACPEGVCTGGINEARDANKAFVDLVLNNSGNNVGLVGYESNVEDVDCHDLSDNNISLKNEVDSWRAVGGTCICCGINKAVTQLDANSSSERYKSIVVMSDGAATLYCDNFNDYSGSGSGGTSETIDKQWAIDAACNAWENYSITVHAIGFGPSADEDTLKNISACGNGSYYYANVGNLIDIYEDIAGEIIDASYKEQTILIGGNISTTLYPDSYLEFNYSQLEVPYGLITTSEKKFQDVYSGNFSVLNSSEILEAIAISYSGSRWTDNVEINSNSIYNLTNYGEDYTQLGDPYPINIPTSYVGENNLVRLTTGVNAGNSTYGSVDNKIIYTIRQNVTSYSEIVAFAQGCIWTIDFEDDSSDVINVPATYAGSKECYYQASGTNISNDNDAAQLATYSLLKILDPDLNGKIDVKFTEQNLKISLNEITGIPYIISTEVQARRWS